jgi:hypothetical protein
MIGRGIDEPWPIPMAMLALGGRIVEAGGSIEI